MKELLLGNDAVARGLYEAGCCLASSYPGTPSTEITEAAARYDEIYCEWAPNEKVALETAIGACIAGRRSFSAMKHVGLNVAADPLFTVSYTGVNAGLIVAVADDPGMHSSQNEQDSRHYAQAAKLPMLEPSDSAECFAFTKLAYELSEQFDTPVLLRLSTRVSHSQSLVEIGERVLPEKKEYQKNPAKYVMMPGYAKLKHPVVEQRTCDLAQYAETSPVNRVIRGSRAIGVITSGAAYQYAREALGEQASYLKLGMVHPLPEKMIRDFAASVDMLYVIEELDPYLENYVKSLGISCHGKDTFPLIGEISPNMVAERILGKKPDVTRLQEAIPVRPPVMCAGCPHRGLFYVLSKLKVMVSGDIGCYTLGASAPLSAMDTTICMGASISALHGFNKIGGPETEKKSVAVIGDSTFMHSGMTGLANISYNGSNTTVIILDNSITGMTGHQQNPTTGYNIKGDPATKISLEKVCEAVGIRRVTVVDPYDLKAVEEAVKRELEAEEPSVIISRRPCALLKYVKHNPPLTVDADRCRTCRACMKLGCPAISIRAVAGAKKAVIDGTQCVGCGVCRQLCAFDAIQGVQ